MGTICYETLGERAAIVVGLYIYLFPCNLLHTSFIQIATRRFWCFQFMHCVAFVDNTLFKSYGDIC